MADGGELMKRFASRQPTLRAADGGMFVPGENQGGAGAQMYGRASANLASMEKTSLGMAGASAAPAGASNPMHDRMTNAAHSVQQYQPMMAMPTIGLRDGGDLRTGVGGNVPSQGHAQSEGDTIPARYTPGEFVVSNDMLDAAPQLRSQLRDLRGNVLAAKGMTPEQADAKALGYDGSPSGGQDGQQTQRTASLRDAAQMDRPLGVQGVRPGNSRLPGAEGGRGGVTLRALDGFTVDERPWNGAQDARTFAQQPGPGNPNVGPNGSSQAQAFQQTRAPTAVAPTTAPSPSATAAEAPKVGRLRGAADATRNFFSGAGESAGSVGGAFKSVASPLVSAGKSLVNAAGKASAPLTLGAAAYDGFNTDTETYAKRFGLERTEPSLARDLGVRALGVASDVGNNLTFGLAKKHLYRDDGTEGSPTANAVLPPTPQNKPTLREPNPYEAANAAKLAQAQTPTLRGRDPGQVNVTRQANGNLSFSGKDISGPVSYTGDGAKDRPGLRNPGSTFSVMPAQDTSSLRNPDGSTWSAGDNAIMAANLRDGVDKYRGTSRGNPTEEAIPAIGEFGHNKAVAARQAERNNQTTLRGQTLQSQDNRYGHELSTQSNMMRLRQEQFQNDRTYNAGRDDANFTQKQAAQKQAVDDIADSLPPVMVDGKPTRDLAGAAQHLDAQNRLVASQIAQAKEHLKLNPNDARMASVLRGLEQRGIAMLSPEAKKRAAQGVGARNMVNETATGAFNPVGTSAVATNDPVTSLRKRGNDYITQTGDVVPKRHVDKEGGVFGFGGRPSLRFNDLITEGERLDATKK